MSYKLIIHVVKRLLLYIVKVEKLWVLKCNIILNSAVRILFEPSINSKKVYRFGLKYFPKAISSVSCKSVYFVNQMHAIHLSLKISF